MLKNLFKGCRVTPMPNQRKAGKRMVGFYATEEEATAMMEAAKREGKTLADWLRALIPENGSKAAGTKPARKKAQ
jgi:hypothetical protein